MSAGSGGMITAGSAGMGMGAAGHPMDAGADEDAAVDAGQLADAGADAAVVAPTPAEICAAYCQSKQDFIGGGSSSTCGSLDNSSCQNDCAVALQNTPVPCNLRLGELFACQTAAADYVCTTGGNDPTVDQNTGVCPDENVGIQTCVPDGS